MSFCRKIVEFNPPVANRKLTQMFAAWSLVDSLCGRFSYTVTWKESDVRPVVPGSTRGAQRQKILGTKGWRCKTAVAVLIVPTHVSSNESSVLFLKFGLKTSVEARKHH